MDEEKMIFIKVADEYIPITDLKRKDYENFLDAMLRLTSLYIKRIRENEPPA